MLGILNFLSHGLRQSCCPGDKKKQQSLFMASVRLCEDPTWTDLQELLDREVETVLDYHGLHGEQKVNVNELRSLRPSLLSKATCVKEDLSDLLDRYDRYRDQDVYTSDFKLTFKLLLQARSDALRSLLQGRLESVWRRRVGDEKIGTVNMDELDLLIVEYATRLPNSGVTFTYEDVAHVVVRILASWPLDRDLDNKEFASLIQELYFEVLMLVWIRSSAAPYGHVPVGWSPVGPAVTHETRIDVVSLGASASVGASPSGRSVTPTSMDCGSEGDSAGGTDGGLTSNAVADQEPFMTRLRCKLGAHARRPPASSAASDTSSHMSTAG